MSSEKELKDEIVRLRAEISRLKPVVEAAEAWRAGKTEDEELFVFVDAYIDARDGATKTNERE